MFRQKRENLHRSPIGTLAMAIVAFVLIAFGGSIEALETRVCRIEVLVFGKPLS